MKCTVNTQALKSGINLVIIDSNISKFYQKSLLTQITIKDNKLIIGTEFTSIISEVVFNCDCGTEEATILVDSSLFKKLISTIDTAQIEFTITENVLKIKAGNSEFSLPKFVDSSDFSLSTPKHLEDGDAQSITTLDTASWKFIKDHQLYAKADSYMAPAYTYVYNGASGDIIVGDYMNSIFTHSTVGQLDSDCLLSDTIINLFTSLPTETKIVSCDGGYVVSIAADSYTYTAQVTPTEENDQIGSYNAPIILDMMQNTESDSITVNSSKIITALNQAALLSSDKTSLITFDVQSRNITLKDRNVNCTLDINADVSQGYTLDFRAATLKELFSKCPNSEVTIYPTMSDGDAVGITVVSNGLTSVLAAIES